ncbi:helicase [Frankia sp. CcI156]|uniref:Helicase n=2 Tax=Frankia casuarinae (strain DSM 45818 / CECT 9043 / HFP020203 / CcI3) TaxID=106370 RepID=Q2JEF6_FRACC|nr:MULTISPECIES: ATP-binding domain-containing protein [Frankia]ABD10336.1 putative helicase [Frankia casuarinae]ETA01904.1 DNA/RNA helicase, superfamily I [Frankia sp. CcI6]EYT92649.1 DNA/RNA helicase, superfamily I [Frankia casuarinae]KDA41424.1 DNA/RNA helicase, superfamily I [Frankia sp. BMG5.23]KEZ38319.1 DNA/RNA helicase, superfamily I [Frankia sp. CeD]
MPTTQDVERAREQAYLDTLYIRLDEVREITRGQLRRVLLESGTGTPQSLVERDVFAATHADRLARLDAAEGRLCFGAMDYADGRRTYIGRIGLSDSGQEPILVDWRAPVATAFYRATLADPHGLVRRRHLRTKGREVTGIADDPLSLPVDMATGTGSGTATGKSGGVTASGDTMLLEALAAPRTGRMHDIIATLQAEQDRIIRARANGVLVVDGGPGTGKTAVALHRAAYLLYNDRARLDQSGVLVVGPSPVFLRYIDQVLPSLGETGVIFATPGRLFPGVDAHGVEDVATAALKGDPRMVEVIAAAVRDRQRLPRREVLIPYDDRMLRLGRDTVARARTRARRSRRPHNSARRIFLRELLAELTTQVVNQIPGGLLDADERGQITRDLWSEEGVRTALDGLWPLLTPQRLLGELFADPAALARAAGSRLTPAERSLLEDRRTAAASARIPVQRDGAGTAGTAAVDRADRAWTPADVPLLDEAAELLGDPDEETGRETARRAEREREEEREYARGVVDMLGLEGQVDAEALAERWSGPRARRSAADHAREDRTWTFGHLIVDEAQEVSPMLWRLLWRRCPGRTATLVGDLAQTARPGAPASWGELLGPAVGDRFTVERLSVNYRTPQEIMDVAADVLRAQDPTVSVPLSVRSVGCAPTAVRVGDVTADEVSGLVGLLGTGLLETGPLEDRRTVAQAHPGDLVAAVVYAASRAASEVGDGRVAVICRPQDIPGLRGALMAALPDLAVAADSVDPASAVGNALDAPVAVLSVAESKGLEFDAVVLVEPAALLAGPTRGLADLYVALTRATRFLTVVYSGELPPVLGRLAPR